MIRVPPPKDVREFREVVGRTVDAMQNACGYAEDLFRLQAEVEADNVETRFDFRSFTRALKLAEDTLDEACRDFDRAADLEAIEKQRPFIACVCGHLSCAHQRYGGTTECGGCDCRSFRQNDNDPHGAGAPLPTTEADDVVE